jgi:hypothetical protein
MSVAPASAKLRRAIRDVVDGEFVLGVERVVLLDLQGEVRDVLWLSQGEDILRRRRADMLSAHSLGAVIHLSASRIGSHVLLHVIEVFDDSGASTVHAMTSAPAQHIWRAPEPAELTHWRDVWGKEAPDTET